MQGKCVLDFVEGQDCIRKKPQPPLLTKNKESAYVLPILTYLPELVWMPIGRTFRMYFSINALDCYQDFFFKSGDTPSDW